MLHLLTTSASSALRSSSKSTLSYFSRAMSSYKADLKRAFFAQPHFAVVGASKDEQKWGAKVLKWYKERNLDVTPVHPRETELQGIPAVRTLAELPNLSTTAVSVITAPPITIGLLHSMLDSTGPPYLWLQPGTFDDSVTSFITDKGLEDRVVYGNHACVLVEGDDIRARL